MTWCIYLMSWLYSKMSEQPGTWWWGSGHIRASTIRREGLRRGQMEKTSILHLHFICPDLTISRVISNEIILDFGCCCCCCCFQSVVWLSLSLLLPMRKCIWHSHGCLNSTKRTWPKSIYTSNTKWGKVERKQAITSTVFPLEIHPHERKPSI